MIHLVKDIYYLIFYYHIGWQVVFILWCSIFVPFAAWIAYSYIFCDDDLKYAIYVYLGGIDTILLPN